MAVCIGSGVPGDLLEWGHDIVPGTEAQMFRPIGRNKRSCSRCRVCASTLYHWSKRVNFREKARSTHQAHARNMVREGFAETFEQALLLLTLSGVTIEFIAVMFREAINKECPGLCGQPVRHVITDNGDLHFDWRDPRFPLTPENCGPLCDSCNKQKARMPWPEFMGQQRAIRINLDAAVPREPPLRLFDPDRLFDIQPLHI